MKSASGARQQQSAPMGMLLLLTVTLSSLPLVCLPCLGNNSPLPVCMPLCRFSFAPSDIACLCSYPVKQLGPSKFAGILHRADPHCGRSRTANYWVMRQDPNQKIPHSMSASESWVMLCFLRVVVLFFLSLSISFSLNTSARAEEMKKRRKENPFALQC